MQKVEVAQKQSQTLVHRAWAAAARMKAWKGFVDFQYIEKIVASSWATEVSAAVVQRMVERADKRESSVAGSKPGADMMRGYMADGPQSPQQAHYMVVEGMVHSEQVDMARLVLEVKNRFE